MSDPFFIHDSASVSDDAIIGQGTRIWDWSKVRERARIGSNTNIGQGVYVDFEVVIGANCKVQNGVSIYHGVTIEDDVFIGPMATFTNDKVPRAFSSDWDVTQTRVAKGASIGANATIVCGVVLGTYSMIAAGAVVTKDVPAHGLVMGNPGVIVDFVTMAGRRLFLDPDDGSPDPKLFADL